MHRAEFQDFESSTIEATACLPEENRTRRIDPYRECYYQQQRCDCEEPKRREAYVGCPLCGPLAHRQRHPLEFKTYNAAQPLLRVLEDLARCRISNQADRHGKYTQLSEQLLYVGPVVPIHR